ncbi:MAG: hypothetical protein IJX16_00175 [Clostridia bacterium]|nr:hypothetical protein [Clostridia bacterium]
MYKKVRMFPLKRNGEATNFVRIKDENGNVICDAEKRSMADYIDECLHGNNECASLLEKFVRIKDGKDAILWYDAETDELFITY